MPGNLFQKFYAIISRIPEGKVATYGQIAVLAGHPRSARMVGWALNQLDGESDIPWHRVINASGRSSFDQESKRRLQQALLEEEGVRFDASGRVDLEIFQWLKDRET